MPNQHFFFNAADPANQAQWRIEPGRVMNWDEGPVLRHRAAPPEPIQPAEPVKNDPELWTKMLNAVKEIYEPDYCCVAGGAVRDYFMGKPPKDVDIFIKLSDGLHKGDDLIHAAECLGWRNVEHVMQPPEYKGNQKILLLLRGYAFNQLVELIFVNTKPSGKDIVDTFDFTINQHWFDNDIHSTPNAKFAIAKRKWTAVTKGQKLTPEMLAKFKRVNDRHGKIYKLDEGEPWYRQFAEKAKIK